MSNTQKDVNFQVLIYVYLAQNFQIFQKILWHFILFISIMRKFQWALIIFKMYCQKIEQNNIKTYVLKKN